MQVTTGGCGYWDIRPGILFRVVPFIVYMMDRAEIPIR